MEKDLICKYVVKDGKDFGESIDVHDDSLIVKSGSDFFAVSVNSIEKVESDKIYISEFDKNQAKNLGKKWIDEKSKPLSLEELKLFEEEEKNNLEDTSGSNGQ